MNVTRFLVLIFCTVSAFARIEAPVEPPLRFGPVATFFAPSIASDGVQSFAVWNDGRDRATNAIYGARLDADGELLDSTGVRLIDDGIGQPAIAYGEARYLVIDSSTRFVIVDRDANVVARGMLAAGAFGPVRVVFNGRDFVVFWGYESVNVSIVDGDGRASEPIPLVAPRYEVRLHAAAANGSRLIVLYTRGSELRAAVTSATGVPVSDSAIAQMVFAEVPASVAASGSGFAAVWQPLAGRDVAAARLDAGGALVQGPVVVVSNAERPEIVANRLFTLEGDLHHYRLVGRTLADDLTVGPPATLIDAQSLSAGSYAASAKVVVANLHDPNRQVPEEGLYAVAVDAPAGTRLVSRAAVAQLEPRVATGETGTLVAWRGEFSLRATFLPRAGEPDTFAIAAGRIQSHSVAAQGRMHLVAWESGEGVSVRLYRENAESTGTRSLDTSGRSPAAASDGNGFIVAWVSYPTTEIRIARITNDGEIAESSAVRYGNVSSLPAPALACDDGQCVLVWRNQTARWTCPRFACLVVDERVVAMRFDSSLSPVDETPLVLSGPLSGVSEVTAAAGNGAYAVSWVNVVSTYIRTLSSEETLIVPGRHPALAREDRGWLVVREVEGELVAMRLRDAGAPYEFPLIRDAQTRSAPALATDGGHTVAAYERTTRGEAAGGVPRIFVTTVGPAEPRRRAISR